MKAMQKKHGFCFAVFQEFSLCKYAEMLEKIVEWMCWIFRGEVFFLLLFDSICFAADESFPSYRRMYAIAILIVLLAVEIGWLFWL